MFSHRSHCHLLPKSAIALVALIGIEFSAAQAQNTALKSTNAIKNTDALATKRPIYQDDSKLEYYDVTLCAEYLSLLPNSRYRYQAKKNGLPATIGETNILGNTTNLKLQIQPGQQTTTSKTTTTNTTTSSTTTTTTETVKTQTPNTFSLSSGQSIDLSLDNRTGLLRINGKVIDSFETRMIQEDCRRAIQN